MLLKPSVLAVLSISLSSTLWAQSTPVPVVDINSSPAVSRSTAQPAPQPALNQTAELIMVIEQLQEEVRFLRGQVEEQNHKMSKMERDQRDRYRDLDRRILAITQQLNNQSAPVAAAPLPTPAEPSADSSSADTSAAPSASAAANVQGESAYEAYDKAFKLVRARAFDDALKAFDEFLRFYPDSSYAPNAIYWTAEVHRAKTPPDYAAAKEAFTQLIAKFPRHSKTAEAHYKLGLTLDALGDKAEARKQMQKTMELYPDQSVSKLANEYLSS